MLRRERGIRRPVRAREDDAAPGRGPRRRGSSGASTTCGTGSGPIREREEARGLGAAARASRRTRPDARIAATSAAPGITVRSITNRAAPTTRPVDRRRHRRQDAHAHGQAVIARRGVTRDAARAKAVVRARHRAPTRQIVRLHRAPIAGSGACAASPSKYAQHLGRQRGEADPHDARAHRRRRDDLSVDRVRARSDAAHVTQVELHLVEDAEAARPSRAPCLVADSPTTVASYARSPTCLPATMR